MYSLCLYVKCSVQAYRSWTGVQESSRLYFTLRTLAQHAVFGVQRVSSRWLQLVATPVKYNHNSIENTSTLSYRVTVVLIASKLDVGLSHMVANVDSDIYC